MLQPRVGIVGGGLAGLAAAVALVDQGLGVELFETRRKLGGRAGSFVDPADGTTIDHCQHVAMGCCTNFRDFCRRTEISELFERHRRLHFFARDGKRNDFEPSPWLPAPLHLAPALWRLSYLSLAEKISVARAMRRLMHLPLADDQNGPTVLVWLQKRRQTPSAIERFWKVVLVSALGESLERASLVAAQKVFRDGFWAHRDAADVLVPRVSLHELYDERVGDWLRSRGVSIHLGASVDSLCGDARCTTSLRLVSGDERPFDFFLLAVPWTRVGKLLPPALKAALDPDRRWENIAGAPISSLHLWFDRPITELPHAVLIERLPQWLFSRPKAAASGEHYYQVVISASHELTGRDRQQVMEEALADLRAVFPLARQAGLHRWRLVTEQNAVFSVRPGIEALRPAQVTAVSNLMLAGDWTATGWPATMEGAIRSGYLAAEAILSRLGAPARLVVPELGQRP